MALTVGRECALSLGPSGGGARTYAGAHCDAMSTEQAAAKAVKEGDWVKICRSNERFWCRVVDSRGGDAASSARVLTAVADNDLLYSDVRCGDHLEIDASEVLEVATAADKQRYIELVRATGSAATAALLWRDARLMRAEATPMPGAHRLVQPPW